MFFGEPVDIQTVSLADLLPGTLLLADNIVHQWQTSLPMPDSSGSVSIVYSPPAGNSVLIDKVSYGPGKIQASNVSIAESNIDLPFRDSVAYIEKLVMNSSGTSSTPLANLSVLSFVQVGGNLNEGSIDIGVGTVGSGAAVTKPAEGIARYLGYKRYELTNHLGNVLATISDYRKTSFTGSVINYFKPDVRSAQDHYPFGMLMVGRNYNAQEYAYGFNGKENDNEVKGTGNQQDYGMRTYDPRLGRFLSIDPISGQFPMLTPFQFASNTPIQAIDLDGMESYDYRLAMNQGKLSLTLQDVTDIVDKVISGYITSTSSVGIPVATPIYSEVVNQRQEYFINGRRTNLGTVNQFQNRKSNDPLTSAALNKIESDFSRFGGEFPEEYYAEFGSFLFNTSISQTVVSSEQRKVSAGVLKTMDFIDPDNLFGKGKFSSVFHAYENLVRQDDNTGYDKLQHFAFSANYSFSMGRTTSYTLGVLKEFFNDELNSHLPFSNDIGWDDRDMRANELGINFGDQLRNQYTSAGLH